MNDISVWHWLIVSVPVIIVWLVLKIIRSLFK